MNVPLRSWLPLALLVSGGGACSAAGSAGTGGADGGSSAQAPCWAELGLPLPPSRSLPQLVAIGEVALDADGVGAPLALALPQGAAGLTLRVTAGQPPPGEPACVQVHALETAGGVPWVTPPATFSDRGAYCVSCPERVAVGVGYGSFVLPSSGAPPTMDTGFRLRVAARDCPTYLSYHPASGVTPRLRVELAALEAPPAEAVGLLPLELVFAEGSAFFGSEVAQAEVPALIAAVNDELAQAGLEVRVARARELAAEGFDPLVFPLGDHRRLAALRSLAAVCGGVTEEAAQGYVPVYFVGCLREESDVFGSHEPLGYTTHIPGGFAPPGLADGVFLRGRGCSSATPGSLSAAALGRLLAHELGHYLGLYHTVESDGTPDALDDTGTENLMHYLPQLSASTGLSPQQRAVVRRHPLVRWPR